MRSGGWVERCVTAGADATLGTEVDMLLALVVVVVVVIEGCGEVGLGF